MIAAFTYYTANGTNPAGNTPNMTTFRLIFNLAIMAAHKGVQDGYFTDVVVFTDRPALLDQLDLPPSVTVEYVNFHDVAVFDPRFWNFPKLITYRKLAKKAQPFLHIDNDLILETLPTNLNSAILCEGTRDVFQPMWQFGELGIRPVSNCQRILNSGVLGGHNYQAFLELYDRVAPIMKKLEANKLGKVRYGHLVMIEEIMMKNIVGIDNVTPINCQFTHYQGKRAKKMLELNL